ncbi:hypothetical protein CEXT_354301 [Caerostris extrusa]|uniref:Uncharacterized protein n=1 Tax=Caerostris extrusa TaxID=172846 RepID=A0AAV4XBB7_CAEEX|nr:hypothetical protein CEXT_354301 [Caerostris extrusa]
MPYFNGDPTKPFTSLSVICHKALTPCLLSSIVINQNCRSFPDARRDATSKENVSFAGLITHFLVNEQQKKI